MLSIDANAILRQANISQAEVENLVSNFAPLQASLDQLFNSDFSDALDFELAAVSDSQTSKLGFLCFIQ
jgi:hypothetical protein